MLAIHFKNFIHDNLNKCHGLDWDILFVETYMMLSFEFFDENNDDNTPVFYLLLSSAAQTKDALASYAALPVRALDMYKD